MAEETNCQMKNKRWASDKVTAKLGTSLVFGFQQTQVQTQHVFFCFGLCAAYVCF
jgi:hypothetical protein